MTRFLLPTATILTALFFFAASATGQEWPHWRGPQRDGQWNESGIIDSFPENGLNIKWRVEIGSGYSGPTVAKGRVYVMDRLTVPQQVERVSCFDAESGKIVWQHEYNSVYRIDYPAGPRSSVTVSDGKAYSHGAMGQLKCWDAATGDVVWEKDLNAVYSIQSRQRRENRMPIWGMTCSPLIVDNKLIIQTGAQDACVVAFDRENGTELWKSLDDRGQYSSPILIRQGKSDVVVVWTGDSVSGLSPDDGRVFWSVPWKPRNMPIGCASPIFFDNHLFLTSFYDGSMLLKVDPENPAAEKVWHLIGANERSTKALHSMISTPICIDGYIYGVDSYGQFRCLEALTGRRVWEDQTAVPAARWSNIHFVQNGPRVWMFNERGQLILAKLSPSGFEELGRTDLIQPTKAQLNRRGGVCWSHPAFAMKSVFVRNDTELLRADLAK